MGQKQLLPEKGYPIGYYVLQSILVAGVKSYKGAQSDFSNVRFARTVGKLSAVSLRSRHRKFDCKGKRAAANVALYTIPAPICTSAFCVMI